MTNRDLVAIGASRGGFDALRFIVSKIPLDFPASILVTLHLPSNFPSALDKILASAGPLRAQFATEGGLLQKSQIYIAPPERHLILEGDRLALGAGPRENFARPAIDPMLRSVGLCCGYRAIGVVMTGELMDGASGLADLKACGGIAVVQDPADAAYAEMPQQALEAHPDHVSKLFDIPGLLESLVLQPAQAPLPAPQRLKLEVAIAKEGNASVDEMDAIGRRSTFVCPECGGVLWEVEDKDAPSRYRCHVGHAYHHELLRVALDSNVRVALGTALRTLSERLALTQKLQKDAVSRGQRLSAESWARKVSELEMEAETIRKAIAVADTLQAQFSASKDPA
ncbi:chemotaxis protein CheB [Methylocystis echinoides]|uniref:chemotaxis protein CheB n=1 Tax=Methylocystis echinoides TaxID=29468 RepID=UPI00343F443E